MGALAFVSLVALAGCLVPGSPPGGALGTAAPVDPVAKQLFLSKGCGACHRAPNLPDAQGTIGPNLKGVGDPIGHPKIAAVLDNTPDNLKHWLLNPAAVKPGTAMPNLGLTDDEAATLVTLLETFK